MLAICEREVAVYLLEQTQKAIAGELAPVTLTADNILDVQVMLLATNPRDINVPRDEPPLCYFEVIGAYVLPLSPILDNIKKLLRGKTVPSVRTHWQSLFELVCAKVALALGAPQVIK